jgi:GT2 family glycosyltransferase
MAPIAAPPGQPVTPDVHPPAPLLSVIVVTYDSAAVIDRALSGVQAQLPLAEVIIVDNGSTDATLERVAKYRPARVIVGHGNVGFGTAVNLGARAARGQLLLVHNPDAFPRSIDWDGIVALARTRPFGLVGCLLQAGDHTQRSLNVAWGWRKELWWSLAEWYLVPRELSASRPRPRGRAKTWVCGAALLVARDEFLHLGGFDERLFLYYEDFDLSRAYASHGLAHSVTNCVTLEHIGQSSSPRDDDLMTTWALMSLIELATKWDGDAAGDALARSVLRHLTAIAVIGRGVGRIPRLGRRGRQKAQSAERVRGLLLEESRTTSELHYPAARTALRARAGVN